MGELATGQRHRCQWARIFGQPIHVGELVIFLTSIDCAVTSSMEVGSKVIAQDMHA